MTPGLRPFQECLDADLSVQRWGWSGPDAAGVSRHRITSRNVVLAYRARGERERTSGGAIAAWLADVYDLILGREPQKKA